MIRLPFLAFIVISFQQMVVVFCDFFKMQGLANGHACHSLSHLHLNQKRKWMQCLFWTQFSCTWEVRNGWWTEKCLALALAWHAKFLNRSPPSQPCRTGRKPVSHHSQHPSKVSLDHLLSFSSPTHLHPLGQGLANKPLESHRRDNVSSNAHAQLWDWQIRWGVRQQLQQFDCKLRFILCLAHLQENCVSICVLCASSCNFFHLESVAMLFWNLCSYQATTLEVRAWWIPLLFPLLLPFLHSDPPLHFLLHRHSLNFLDVENPGALHWCLSLQWLSIGPILLVWCFTFVIHHQQHRPKSHMTPLQKKSPGGLIWCPKIKVTAKTGEMPQSWIWHHSQQFLLLKWKLHI